MEWLDKANRLLSKHQEREKTLANVEVTVYDNLWDELCRHVEGARSTFPNLRTNDQSHDRAVFLEMPSDLRQYGLPAQINIALDREHHRITVHGTAKDYVTEVSDTLELDLNRGDIPRLVRHGAEVSFSDASVYVLWAFLYPELQPYQPESSVMEVRANLTPITKVPRTTV